MDEEEKTHKIFWTFAGLASCGVIGHEFMKIMKTERAKRKRIKAWEQENIACIRAYKARMEDFIDSPEFTMHELGKRMKEEIAFLDIVKNQPKY